MTEYYSGLESGGWVAMGVRFRRRTAGLDGRGV